MVYLPIRTVSTENTVASLSLDYTADKKKAQWIPKNQGHSFNSSHSKEIKTTLNILLKAIKVIRIFKATIFMLEKVIV